MAGSYSDKLPPEEQMGKGEKCNCDGCECHTSCHSEKSNGACRQMPGIPAYMVAQYPKVKKNG